MQLMFVCTGNICRSPVAAGLLTAWAGQLFGPSVAQLRIISAGIEAPDGRPMDRDSRRALIELTGNGTQGEAHRSRAVTTSAVDEVDLVLTMTRWQRRQLLGLAPRTLRQTFTLAEASALLRIAPPASSDVPVEQRAIDLASRLHAARSHRQVSDRDDIRDPVGRSLTVHRQVAGQIATELRPLADALFAAATAEPMR